MMSEALERIKLYFDELQQRINSCRDAEQFRAVDWKDAYAALARLRERYLFEKSDLTKHESDACKKVFEDDVFIKGMMDLRLIADHILPRGRNPLIATPQNVPIQLTASSSALAVFRAPSVTLLDTEQKLHRIDHLKYLVEATKRIDSALCRAEKILQ